MQIGMAFEKAGGWLLFHEIAGAGEAVVATAHDETTKRVWVLDLDKFTVYKSSALILL